MPERVEFFESLQEISIALRNGTQDQIQGKLDHLDQMLNIVTMSLADIGAEMNSIEDEISINEDLKLQLQTTLSGQEDVDYATAITELQAKMMCLRQHSHPSPRSLSYPFLTTRNEAATVVGYRQKPAIIERNVLGREKETSGAD